MEIVFATRNANKIREVQQLLPQQMKIIGLADIGCMEELPETQQTIEKNSMQKAMYVAEKYGVDCFAEDSGLEVYMLDSEPGVDSAHYSGTRDADANMRLVLQRLKGESNRRARFKTVFTLAMKGEYIQFKGIVTGNITQEPKGTGGFGYDPIFMPDGCYVTFAEMDPEEKNSMSHRAKAFELLKNYLSEHY